MADYKGLQIVFEGDDTSLSAALATINTRAAAAQGSLVGINTALSRFNVSTRDTGSMNRYSSMLQQRATVNARASKSMADRADQLAKAQDNLRQKIADNAKAIDGSNKRVSAMKTAYGMADKAVEQTTKRYDASTKAVEAAATKQAAYMKARAGTVSANVRERDSVSQLTSQLDHYNKKLTAAKSTVERYETLRASGEQLTKFEQSQLKQAANDQTYYADRVRVTTDEINTRGSAVWASKTATTTETKAIRNSAHEVADAVRVRNREKSALDKVTESRKKAATALNDEMSQNRRLKEERERLNLEYEKNVTDVATARMQAENYAAEQAYDTARARIMGTDAGQSAVRITELGDAMQDTGNKMAVTGGIMTAAITRPLVNLGKKALTTGIEYQNSQSRVQGYTQATAEDMQRLDKLAIQLGQDTVFSAYDVSESMEELAKGGLDVKTIYGGGVQASLALAAAGGLDMATAAETVVRSMTAFQLPVEEAGSIADYLANAANKSTAEVADLSQGLANVGQMGYTAGWSLKDTTSAIAYMADRGIDGATAGTQLKVMLQRLVAPTDKARGVMEKYGFSAYDSEGKVKDLSTITRDLASAFGELPDEEKMDALVDIFGMRGINPALALMNSADNATGSIDDYIEAVGRVGGAEEMAEARLGDMGWAFENLSGTIETAAIRISDVKSDQITGIVGDIADKVEQFSNMDDASISAFVDGLVGLAAAGPGLAITGAALKVVGGTLSGIGHLKQYAVAIAGIKNVVGPGLTMTRKFDIALQSAGMTAASAASASAGLAAGLTGLGIAVAAVGIAALVIALEKEREHTAKVKKATEGLSDAIADFNDTSDIEAGKADAVSTALERSKKSMDDARKAHEEYVEEAAKQADVAQEAVDSYEGEVIALERAGEVIDTYTGKSDLSASQQMELKEAIERVNQACGTQYELVDDGTNRIKDENGVIQENTDLIWDNIRAREATARLETISTLKQTAKDTYASAANDYASRSRAFRDEADALDELKQKWVNAGHSAESFNNDTELARVSTQGLTQADRSLAEEIINAKGGLARQRDATRDADDAMRKAAEAAAELEGAQYAMQKAADGGELSLSELAQTMDVAQSAFFEGGKKADLSLQDFSKTIEKCATNGDRLKEVINDPAAFAQVIDAYDGSAESLRGVFEQLGIGWDEAAAAAVEAELQAGNLARRFEELSDEAYGGFASMGYNIDSLAQAFKDAGVSADDLKSYTTGMLEEMAASCDYNVETMTNRIKTINDLKLDPKELYLNDDGSLKHIMGSLIDIDNQTINGKHFEVVDDHTIKDEMGNVWDLDKMTINDKPFKVTDDGTIEIVDRELGTIQRFKIDDKSVHVWADTSAYWSAINSIKSATVGTYVTVGGAMINSARGGIINHASGGVATVFDHADGFIATGPTMIAPNHRIGENGAEYYDGKHIVPLTNKQYSRPFASVIAEEIARDMQYSNRELVAQLSAMGAQVADMKANPIPVYLDGKRVDVALAPGMNRQIGIIGRRGGI